MAQTPVIPAQAMPVVARGANDDVMSRLEIAAASAAPATRASPATECVTAETAVAAPEPSDGPPAKLPSTTAVDSAAVEPDPRTAQQRNAAKVSAEISRSVGAIVRVLTQTRHGKHFSLGDLEWLVLPAVASRQFKLAEMTSENGENVYPAGVIFWASVSPEIDQRLSENASNPVKLRPDEWTSGNIIWLIEASGHPKVVHSLLE